MKKSGSLATVVINHKFISNITAFFYMALSHKNWELSNSCISLAEMDIDRGLDFPHLDRHQDQ